MKYILSLGCVIGIILVLVLCGGGMASQEEIVPENYLRIHIRANSNDAVDQEVKYKVKDAVVDALIPVLSKCETKAEAVKTLRNNFSLIESVADNVLKANHFSYTSSARISNEFFPTRVYENITLPEGNYDALILNLGSGEGNNWWCVVYPAFCFLQSKNSDNVVYISQIWEIIKNILKL